MPPDRITVAGHSKGADIALRVSDMLDDPGLRYGILAICGNAYLDHAGLNLHGKVLSVFESSDDKGRSCRPLVDRSDADPTFHEVEISIGGGHGAFYYPRDAWVLELLDWTGVGGAVPRTAGS